MKRREEEEAVLLVACLTEDRAPDEQRAMLAMALRLDKDWGEFTNMNTDRRSPCLTRLVEATYDPSEGRHVSLTSQQRGDLDRLEAKWQACERCGNPVGVHYADDRCPR